jgi:glycosyltransferase involved in cell wall biosynthesis
MLFWLDYTGNYSEGELVKMIPILSIIVPVYNVEQYIVRCIESILSNDLSKVEVLIVNDGSTDKSIELIREIISSTNAITLYEKENGGLSSARNYGFDLAQGDYVWYVDSDDHISSCSISTIVKKIEETEVPLLSLNYSTTSREGNPMNNVRSACFYITEYLNTIRNPETNVWKYIFRRNLLIENDIRYIEGVLVEDIPYLASVFAEIQVVHYIEDVCYYYEDLRDSSIMNTLSVKRINDTLSNIDKALLVISKMDDVPRRIYRNELFVEWCYTLSFYKELSHTQQEEFIFTDFRSTHVVKYVPKGLLMYLLYLYRITRNKLKNRR